MILLNIGKSLIIKGLYFPNKIRLIIIINKEF